MFVCTFSRFRSSLIHFWNYSQKRTIVIYLLIFIITSINTFLNTSTRKILWDLMCKNIVEGEATVHCQNIYIYIYIYIILRSYYTRLIGSEARYWLILFIVDNLSRIFLFESMPCGGWSCTARKYQCIDIKFNRQSLGVWGRRVTSSIQPAHIFKVIYIYIYI